MAIEDLPFYGDTLQAPAGKSFITLGESTPMIMYNTQLFSCPSVITVGPLGLIKSLSTTYLVPKIDYPVQSR